MANRFTAGNKAISECDRCGIRTKLKDLKKLVIKTKQVAIKVCNECWEEDHPQLQLGMYPVSDPQAVRDPRPDFSGYPQSREQLVPVYNFIDQYEYTSAGGAIGTVTVVVPVPIPYLFLDTFDGPAGPLSGHVANTGQSWVNARGSTVGTTQLQLDGTGNLRATNTLFKSAGVSLSLSGNSFIVETEVVVPVTGVDLVAIFYIANDINNIAAGSYTSFQIGYIRTTGMWRCSITDNSGTTGFLNMGTFGVGTQSFAFVLNGTGKYIYLGGLSGTLSASRAVATTFTNAGVIFETSPNAGAIGINVLSVN